MPARRRGGGGGAGDGTGSFNPTKSNLYPAVKAIFHPDSNAGVEADDTNNELDVAAGGAALQKATNSDIDAGTNDTKYVTPAKVQRVRNALLGSVATAGNTLGKLYALIQNRLTQTEVDARIASWARTGQTNPGTSAIATLRDSVATGGNTLKKLYDLVLARLPLAGGTLTGALTLSGAPTADLHAATKKYVDDNAGSGSGDPVTGTLEARVERINFDNLSASSSDTELTPSAGGISVINGAGDAEILSGISGNDFTVAAGVYLVNVHGDFNASNNVTIGFDVRRASDDAELDQSNTVFIRSTRNIHTSRILLVLAADTAVNFFATRSGNVSISALHAEFVKLSSGGNVHSAHNRGIGWAAQQVPNNAEIIAAAVFTTDVLTIPNPDPDGTIDDDDTPGWLFFYVPDDAGAPDSAKFDGNTHDILGGFTRLASGTYAGHIVYGSNAEQDPAILGTGSRTLTLEYD